MGPLTPFPRRGSGLSRQTARTVARPLLAVRHCSDGLGRRTGTDLDDSDGRRSKDRPSATAPAPPWFTLVTCDPKGSICPLRSLKPRSRLRAPFLKRKRASSSPHACGKAFPAILNGVGPASGTGVTFPCIDGIDRGGVSGVTGLCRPIIQVTPNTRARDPSRSAPCCMA